MTRATVLVVDDEPDIRLLARTLLATRYEVVEASGGIAALEVLASRTDIDVVLLDIRMPDIDGFEVLARLAKREMLDHLPVVVFTAFSGQAVIDQALQLGARAVLSKPFTAETLHAVLAAATSGAR